MEKWLSSKTIIANKHNKKGDKCIRTNDTKDRQPKTTNPQKVLRSLVMVICHINIFFCITPAHPPHVQLEAARLWPLVSVRQSHLHYIIVLITLIGHVKWRSHTHCAAIAMAEIVNVQKFHKFGRCRPWQMVLD